MDYNKFICPPPGCPGIFPQRPFPINPIECCFSVENGPGDSIILERDNVPVACVMDCPLPTGCYIACVTPTGPNWTTIPLIVNDDVIDADSGIPITFNVLNNDIGVGLTLTQINGVDVSTGDIITLPSGATLAVLENGNINSKN